jgi:hypothetical protein
MLIVRLLVVELQAEQCAHDRAHCLLLVLEHHELIRVRVPGHEEQVEQPNGAFALKPRELVCNASLEVCPRLEAHGHELNGRRCCNHPDGVRSGAGTRPG